MSDMYSTKARAFWLVTATPDLARDGTLFALARTSLSTMIRRQIGPFRNASFSFSSPVSMFTSRSTGRTGWGQATSVSYLVSRRTPSSSARQVPARSSRGWPVKAVALSM